MKLPRRKFLQLSSAIVALSALPRFAWAQAYPSRPITIIVPFAAGGPSDVLARVLGERIRAVLGQTVVIENVTGAGGTVGVTRAVRSAPDGYTLSFGHLGTHVINGAIYPLTFDLISDLEPIGLIGGNPQMVVSKNAVPARDLKELIAWIKANQDAVTIGTAGVGSGSHFSGLYFQSLIGTKARYVPYRGTGPAMQDLVAGNIDVIVDQASNVIPQVQAGTIKAYAVTAAKRTGAAPNIPTVDEAGLPGYHIWLWSGLWAPKGTPQDIVASLNGALRTALADAAVLKRFDELGLEAAAASQQTPDGLRAHQKAEADKWWPMIKGAGVKPDG
jgi:tripartite-type tricarboxylate transporter receptor subunit TctC